MSNSKDEKPWKPPTSLYVVTEGEDDCLGPDNKAKLLYGYESPDEAVSRTGGGGVCIGEEFEIAHYELKRVVRRTVDLIRMDEDD